MRPDKMRLPRRASHGVPPNGSAAANGSTQPGLATARELYLQGRYDDALTRLEPLLGSLDTDHGMADDRGRAALLRAWCLIEAKDHDGAVAWLGDAVDRGLVLDEDLGVRILRWNVLLFHEKYGEVEEAVMAVLPEVAEHPSADHAELRLLLGAALRWRGRLEDAVAHVEYACSTFTVLAEPGRCAVAANFLGWTCVSLGRFNEARRWFEKALDLNSKLGARLREAQNYQNLAIVCYKQGDYDTAVELLEKELELVGERDDMQARAHIALGNVRRLQGKFEDSRASLALAWERAVAAGLVREQALALEFQGDLLRDEGQPAEAQVLYARSMDLARRLAPRGDLVMELRRREGECLALEGRLEEALTVLDDARILCKEVGDRFEDAATRRCQAVVLARLGRWSTAIEMLDDAMADLEQCDARHERMIAGYEAARIRLRWSDAVPTGARSERLTEEAWHLALVAHRLDRELDHTPLATAIDDLVNELARRRLPRQRKAETLARTFATHRAPATRIVATSAAMRRVLGRCDGLARYDRPVLIRGESGCGKELLARRLHENSPRSRGPFRRLDCAATPADTLAREIFGTAESGGGMLEIAAGGTLFLGGIEALNDALQERLLTTIRDGTWRPLGAAKEMVADVRIVATTSANLSHLTDRRRFRPDLYYRLRLMLVEVPPLRERSEDVMPLLDHFLTRLEGRRLNVDQVFDADSRALLAQHDWPGNAAELEAVAQQGWLQRSLGEPRLVVRRRRGDLTELAVLASGEEAAIQSAGGRSGLTWETLSGMIARAGGNKTRVARQLGVSRATLYRWLGNLEPDRHSEPEL